ncbi:MAG: hypothetical protein J6A43_03370 [Clostridia bacterium]|nr:hypothetical protein [Clostridia bacterium]
MTSINNTKKLVFISQFFVIVFLSLGIIGRIFQNYGYDILLFKKPAIDFLYMMCFLISYLIEFLTIFFLIKKTKKKLFLFTYLILLPLTVLHIFTWFVSSSTTTLTKLYKYPEFDTAIVIESGHDLLGDYYRFYETSNNILMKKITVTSSGMSSLEDETSYDIKTVNGTIIFTYEDGFDENQIILEYNNGHFEYE